MNSPADQTRPRRSPRPSLAPVFRNEPGNPREIAPASAPTKRILPKTARFLERTAPSTEHTAIAVITILVAAVLLFARLGHYALWDDEALTAIGAQGVWRTGDTTAIIGHNILAYRDGMLLKGFKERSSPPLQFYVVAPFIGLLGAQAWVARLPMALTGLACVTLMLWWLWVDRADTGFWVLFILALFGNVSFFLYFRQCRYYGPTTFLATATGFIYLHQKTRQSVILLSAALLLLLTTNYMAYAACVVMLIVDYAFWQRKRRALNWVDWSIILLPQIIFGLLVVWTWNPTSVNVPLAKGQWLADRLRLLWWNLRDWDACEFGATATLLAAPVLALVGRRIILLRAMVALAIGILVITIVSAQSTANTPVADVRYISWLIPLSIAIEAATLRTICGSFVWAIAVPAACILFCTNLIQGSRLLHAKTNPPLRSTIALYAVELIDPPLDPYTATANWINANVEENASIVSYPDYTCYPLMFHASKAIYGWQFDDKAAPVYSSLPDIEFKDRIPPDYIILFGDAGPSSEAITLGGMIHYSIVATLDVLGEDAFRPELFHRRFRPPPPFDASTDGVRIYKRQV